MFIWQTFFVKSKFTLNKKNIYITGLLRFFYQNFLNFMFFSLNSQVPCFFRTSGFFVTFHGKFEIYTKCLVSGIESKNYNSGPRIILFTKIYLRPLRPASLWFAYLHTNKIKHLHKPTKIKCSYCDITIYIYVVA